jgi:general secretion pathway protein D
MNIRIAILGLLLALPVAVTAQESSSTPSSQGDIELSDLIARFAKRNGKQFIIDPRVHAQVSLAGMDPDRITYEKLLAILNVHLFAAFNQGDWIVVVPDANARQLPTPVYTDRNFKAMPDEIVTLVTKVKNGCAMQMVPVLRPLMPQSAHMAAYPDGQTMILTDHAANVHRVITVIEALERSLPEGSGCPPPDTKK